MNMEELYTYSILLKFGLVSLEQYNIWLDNVFLENENNEFYLQLELCSNDNNKTIDEINYYLYPFIEKLNFSIVGQTLFKAFKEKYFSQPCDLKQLASTAYDVWNVLPSKIQDEEPFLTLCFIDDPISYGDEERTREIFNELFTYYKEE